MDPLNEPSYQAQSPPLLLETDTETPPSAISSADPPPPYPVPSRSRRTRRQARLNAQQHQQSPSRESEPFPYDRTGSISPIPPGADENTPLLGGAAPPSPRSLRSPTRRTAGGGRPRSLSHGSILSYASAAPSLAQTVFSLFGDEDGTDNECDYLPQSLPSHSHSHSLHLQRTSSLEHEEGERSRRSAWRRYFRPLVRRVYWMALFHLLVLNFPYALVTWIFLFVFTLVSVSFSLLPSFFSRLFLLCAASLHDRASRGVYGFSCFSSHQSTGIHYYRRVISSHHSQSRPFTIPRSSLPRVLFYHSNQC